jgi:hypothetical protein
VKSILSLAAMALVFAATPAPAASSSTLLIYDTLSKPFSLVNEIAPVQMSLTHFDTHVESLTDTKVTAADLQKADFILLAGISGFPKLKPDLLAMLERSPKPVMAVAAAASFASERRWRIAVRSGRSDSILSLGNLMPVPARLSAHPQRAGNHWLGDLATALASRPCRPGHLFPWCSRMSLSTFTGGARKPLRQWFL